MIFILQGCIRKHPLAVHRAEPGQIGFEQGIAVDLHRVDAKVIDQAAFKAWILGDSADQAVCEQCLPMGLTVCSAGEGDL